jgi:hypothetical protein
MVNPTNLYLGQAISLSSQQAYSALIFELEIYMTLCPIALVASCSKCPVVGFCPVKTVIGDFESENKPEPDNSKDQSKNSKS